MRNLAFASRQISCIFPRSIPWGYTVPVCDLFGPLLTISGSVQVLPAHHGVTTGANFIQAMVSFHSQPLYTIAWENSAVMAAEPQCASPLVHTGYRTVFNYTAAVLHSAGNSPRSASRMAGVRGARHLFRNCFVSSSLLVRPEALFTVQPPNPAPKIFVLVDFATAFNTHDVGASKILMNE